MTREEYEALKKEIVEKKNALEKELDTLCNLFHDAEIPKDIQKETKSIFKPCGGVNTPELLK